MVGLEVGAREVRHRAVAAARALVGGIGAVLAAKRRAQLLGLVVEWRERGVRRGRVRRVEEGGGGFGGFGG